jgi:predicted aldo/keto reductase-like oxidoreductase
MEYRSLGRTGLSVSAVSLGTEYLLDVPPEQAIAVVRGAVENGVNYFDLFYAQPAFRDTMGRAFRGLRDRVLLTAHLGAAEKDGQYERTRDLERCVAYVEDHLRRYGSDTIDLLFLHNCNDMEDCDAIFAPGGLCDIAERYREEGTVRFIGFSTHDVDIARCAIETDRADVLMFPINLTGHATPGRRELFQACIDRAVGLVAMKPFAGGRLLRPQDELKVDKWLTGGPTLDLRPQAVTPVQCLAYALSQPGVTAVVPGCQDLSQLEESLSWLGAGDVERDFSSAVAAWERFRPGECVYCNHCLPCPEGIDIGAVTRLFDSARQAAAAEFSQEQTRLAASASDCTQCGSCTPRCPFGADPCRAMEDAAELFGSAGH